MSELHLKPLDVSKWDDFVSQHPDALIYHTSVWLDFLKQVYHLNWSPLGIWETDQLVGLLPLQTRYLGPFQLAGAPLMRSIASTPYLGILIQRELLAPTLRALDELLKEQGYDHIEMAFPYQISDTMPLTQLGYTIETCQAVILDLNDRTPDQVWQGMTSACRRAIRKAQANQIIVVEALEQNFLDIYYPMCLEVYQHAGREPHLTREFYKAAWDALADSGRIKILLARHADQIIAGAIFLLYRRAACYLSGASHEYALSLRPNNLIQWHFIQWAIERGYDTYDLGGAVIPGITHFKLGFGGECIPYTRIYRANSRLAIFGRAFYKQTIPWWRSISKILSPTREDA